MEKGQDGHVQEFSAGTTLKDMFLGEEAQKNIVYSRSALDFSGKTSGKREEILEENMMDVKRLLKNGMRLGGADQ